MSRGVFRGNNYKPKIWSFDTNDTVFSPQVRMSGSSLRRPLWKLPNNEYFGVEDLTYTFPNSTGKTVNLEMNSYDMVNFISLVTDGLTGRLDLTPFNNLYWIETRACSSLTGVTLPYCNQNISVVDFRLCNLTGTLDLRPLGDKLGSFIRVGDNPNLTKILHSGSTRVFTYYDVSGADLTGVHDVSMLPHQNGLFLIGSNNNLTGITLSPNTGYTITNFSMGNTNLDGELDLTGMSIRGAISFSFTSNLTNIKFATPSDIGDVSGVWTSFLSQGGGIIGLDLSSFIQLGGQFTVTGCASLTGITHTASTEVFTQYRCYDNDLTGTHDISMLTGLGGDLLMYRTPSLTDVLFPLTTETFGDTFFNAIEIWDCDLGYVNFLPLSGASINGGNNTIELQDNNMTAAEVNQILVDFDNLSSNLNPYGWTGLTLDISGTNSKPDASSGGYNGIAAVDSLTGATNQWTVTTT